MVVPSASVGSTPYCSPICCRVRQARHRWGAAPLNSLLRRVGADDRVGTDENAGCDGGDAARRLPVRCLRDPPDGGSGSVRHPSQAAAAMALSITTRA